MWALTFLRRRGVSASAVLLNPERAHRAGLAAFRKAGGRVVSVVPDDTDLVVDGVVGISGTGPLRPGAAAGIAEKITAEGIPVIAVDIPSGVDVHTGAVDGPAFRAAVTVTFGGYKPVHALGDCGDVRLIDIGLELPESALREFDASDVAAAWPVPGRPMISTPRASPVCWPDRAPTPERQCCVPVRPWRRHRGWSATREQLLPKWFRIGRK